MAAAGIAAVILLWALGGHLSAAEPPVPGAGTQRMAERLERIAREADPMKNPFLNRRAAAVFGRRLRELLSGPGATNAAAVTTLRYRYAVELLNGGESRQAIQEFEALARHLETSGHVLAPAQAAALREQQIIAWLRLGEEENCQARPTVRSCLFPIEKDGVYVEARGSQTAIRLLEAEMARGRHPKWAWLLNLAHMTLGQWPDQVPPAFLIPPRAFASTQDPGRFPDIAPAVGLALDDLAGSVVMDDFDNDGDLDLMTCSWGLRDPLRYFENRGDGRFPERTAAAGLTGLVGGLNLVQADYDNDGWLDVLVLRGSWLGAEGKHPNSLLRNRGGGIFDDVTEAAGVDSEHPTQTAAWFDFDGDGRLDLYVGNESTGDEVHPCELFRNRGDGTFVEMAARTGVAAVGLVKSVHAGDFNDDGRPDLYVSCQDRENLLFRNDGPDPASPEGWRFTNVAAAAGVAQPKGSFPAWFFDYDQDGHLDLYVSSYALLDPGALAADYLGLRHGLETQRLYRNRGDGTFQDVSRETGLARLTFPMSGNFGDLDNDGWPDFHLGTGTPSLAMVIPNRMFRNERGQRFHDVSASGGFGHLQKGHGIAWGDLDLDGDQDVYASIGGAYEGDFYRNALFLNPGHGHGWLKLKLVGTRSNRAGIGARIEVRVEGPDGARSIWKDVNSGATFGASPLRQEIGLGRATAVREVEIWWPASGRRQRLTGLEPNHAYLVREDADRAEPIPLRRFALPPENSPSGP